MDYESEQVLDLAVNLQEIEKQRKCLNCTMSAAPPRLVNSIVQMALGLQTVYKEMNVMKDKSMG